MSTARRGRGRGRARTVGTGTGITIGATTTQPTASTGRGRGRGRASTRTGSDASGVGAGGGRIPTIGSDPGEVPSERPVIVTGKVPPPTFPPVEKVLTISTLQTDRAEYTAKEAIKLQRKVRESPFYICPTIPKPEIKKYHPIEDTAKKPSQFLRLLPYHFPNELITLQISKGPVKKKAFALKRLEDDDDEEEGDENNEEEEDELYNRLEDDQQLSDSDDEWKARDDDDLVVEADDGGGGDEGDL